VTALDRKKKDPLEGKSKTASLVTVAADDSPDLAEFESLLVQFVSQTRIQESVQLQYE